MSWKESKTAVHNLNLNDIKTLLRQHPALFCRLFEIKQRLINEHILDGDNATMGMRRDYFIHAEFK